MDNKQILDVLNMHFKMLEYYGTADKNDLIAIIYLMFICEYYEIHRDISFNDIDNEEIGLTDCMVKKLNAMLECLKKRASILRCVQIDELPSKYHWIIPDDHTEPEPEPEPDPDPDVYEYKVINTVLYADNGEDYVENNALYINGTVNNYILVL